MITEKYLIETSADSISPELKNLINDFKTEVESASEGSWGEEWGKVGRLNAIILEIANFNIYKALELSKIIDVYEAVAQTQLIWGNSHLAGGGQVYKLQWNITNEQLELFKNILPMCKSEADVALTLEYIVLAIKRKINVLIHESQQRTWNYIDNVLQLVPEHKSTVIQELLREFKVLKNIINSGNLIEDYEKFILKYEKCIWDSFV